MMENPPIMARFFTQFLFFLEPQLWSKLVLCSFRTPMFKSKRHMCTLDYRFWFYIPYPDPDLYFKYPDKDLALGPTPFQDLDSTLEPNDCQIPQKIWDLALVSVFTIFKFSFFFKNLGFKVLVPFDAHHIPLLPSWQAFSLMCELFYSYLPMQCLTFYFPFSFSLLVSFCIAMADVSEKWRIIEVAALSRFFFHCHHQGF
jgi:hypothetical protein